MDLNTQNIEVTQRKIGECVADVLGGNVRKATAYISPKLTVKATAQRKHGKRPASITVLVTVGRPNFLERRFIRVCQKSGVCFPLRQIQWKFWPKKK